LRDEPQLQKALKQIISKGNSNDEAACYRLERAGLIKEAADKFVCRCDLYRQYFEEKLG
jgi:hypothetical protein